MAEKTNDVPVPTATNVCSLISTEEMSALLGQHVREATPSSRTHDRLRVSQCFYSTDELSRSVSLTLTESASAPGATRAFWRKAFHRGEESEKKSKEATEAREEEERAGRPPREISGCGEEAYWTAGSLYVLKGDHFLRISLGGPDGEEQKLEKSKALAAKALTNF